MNSMSQESKILKMLRENTNGVENYQFPKHGILRYSARINELRNEGYNILSERIKLNGRCTGIWKYYLIEDKNNG